MISGGDFNESTDDEDVLPVTNGTDGFTTDFGTCGFTAGSDTGGSTTGFGTCGFAAGSDTGGATTGFGTCGFAAGSDTGGATTGFGTGGTDKFPAWTHG